MHPEIFAAQWIQRFFFRCYLGLQQQHTLTFYMSDYSIATMQNGIDDVPVDTALLICNLEL